MRKVAIVFLGCIVFLWLAFPISAAPAQESTDEYAPTYIPQEDLAQMKLGDSDRVLQVIRCYYMEAFGAEGQAGTIDDALQYISTDTYGCFYLVLNGDEVQQVYYKNADGRLTIPNERGIYKSLLEQIPREYANNQIIKLVDPDIEVYRMYLMSTFQGPYAAGDGTMIYYDTNEGEYVYYISPVETEYLMPLQEFVRAAKAVAYMQEHPTGSGYFSVCNVKGLEWMTYYDIHSKDFYLNASPVGWYIAGGCVIVVAAAAVVFLLRRRKGTAGA